MIYDATTRKVSKVIDQAIQGNDAVQNTTSLQPTFSTKSERINYRYFLKFDGSKRMVSDINLNPASGSKDIVNIFIVYRLKSFFANNYWVRNGLFGHDNGGYDKFISFSPNSELIVSGDKNNFNVIGSNPVTLKYPIAAYKTKANAGEINKWICLSVHWDNYTTPAGNNSSVYCNGKKLANFESKRMTGSTQMTLGDLNPNGVAPLDGDIAFFALYKDKLIAEKDILLHHHVLCNWFDIDHDDFDY